MAITPQIASIKASGVYRLEFDKSQVVSIPANQIRLLTGFSKTGPFNTPVFVPDSGFFKQVFGDIDRTLERKDSYFHRSCLAALERGPILALNLLALDAEDEVQYLQFSTAATTVNGNGGDNAAKSGEYSRFYNRDKFFFPESDAFLSVVVPQVNEDVLTPSLNNTNNLLDFVNLGQNPVSVIVRKAAAANVAGFNVTVEEWYGSANVPGFLDKDSLISDFMVDIFLIQGNFGGDFGTADPYERFVADPIYQRFFDRRRGLKRKRTVADTTDTIVEEFFNESEVNLFAQYTACLIPDFIDQLGNNLFVETLVNADTASTGMFCAVNKDLFSGDFLIDGVRGGIDLIGHNIENAQPSTVNFLSYQGAITADIEACESSSVVNSAIVPTSGLFSATTLTSGDIELIYQGSAGDGVYDALAGLVPHTAAVVGSYVKTIIVPYYYVPVIGVQSAPNTVTVLFSGVGVLDTDLAFSAGNIIEYVNPTGLVQVSGEWDGSQYQPSVVGGPASSLFANFQAGVLTDGDTAIFRNLSIIPPIDFPSSLVFDQASYDYIYEGSNTQVEISDPAYSFPVAKVTPFTDDTYQTLQALAQFNIQNTIGGNAVFVKSDGVTLADAGCLDIRTLKGANNITFDIIADSTTLNSDLFPNQILIDTAEFNTGSIRVGNYLVHLEGDQSTPSRLARINSVQGGVTNSTNAAVPLGVTALLVTCQSEVSVDTVGTVKKVELYFPIDSWIEYFNIFTFNGFTLLPGKHIPNGTNERQNDILNGTLNGTNLFKALTDREVINFRYLVDTFGNGIEAGSKAIYTRLCQSRQNALAIINAPSADDFKKNINPSFKDLTGALSTRFISTGGNLSLNPTVRYALPSITQGASFGAFYFPYITVRDLGRNINVPPAAYVSNNFISKYDNALPWSLVAGVRRGVVGGTGVVGIEINLDKEDREFLEPFGLNPIVFQTGAGPTIFANKTAQQTVKSALSSINVREVVIYIQDGIEAILKNFLFEFNTAQTRLEIKTLADNFLSTVQQDDGVFDFRNIMDESNNTPEVIDQNIGILDTFIEPVRGMEILVQRTTILKTGAISSGNFQ